MIGKVEQKQLNHFFLIFIMENQRDVACRFLESKDHLESHYSHLIDSKANDGANVRIIILTVITGYYSRDLTQL